MVKVSEKNSSPQPLNFLDTLIGELPESDFNTTGT